MCIGEVQSRIEFFVGDKKFIYNDSTKIVTFMSTHGVMIQCEVPKDWALTRVFQFMDSLATVSKDLT